MSKQIGGATQGQSGANNSKSLKNSVFEKILQLSRIDNEPKYLNDIITNIDKSLSSNETISLKICSKFEELLISNNLVHKQLQNEICALLLKISNKDNSYKFRASSLEVFSQKLNDKSLSYEVKKDLLAVLSREVSKGNNLLSNKVIKSNLKQQVKIAESLLSNEALAILNNLKTKFACEEDKQPSEILPSIPQDNIKTIDDLLNELKINNVGNKEIIKFIQSGKLSNYLAAIDKKYNVDSSLAKQDKKICLWEGDDISNWAKAIKEDKKLTHNDDFLIEAITIAKRANFLKTGNHLRVIQQISILSLLANEDQGRLLQIATGEGKSTITAITALIRVLQGHKADVITSSPILASRDAETWQGFFAMFKVSCSHNIQKDYQSGTKECYGSDIVYGDAHNFQCDILRHEYKNFFTRGVRTFAETYVLVDEVDSMLVDEASRIAKIASPMPGFEYLAPLLVACWKSLENTMDSVRGDGSDVSSDDFTKLAPEIVGQLTSYLKALINSEGSDVPRIVLPKHLENFAINQTGLWVRSALAAWRMQEKRDYLIIGSEDNRLIAPIDYANTGVIQSNTVWPDGMHQFLQIKHGLKISAESLSTCFLSNVGFFKRYDSSKISGMTGTLGSSDSQELLRRTYEIELGFVPTFKKSQFKEIPGLVMHGEEKWLDAITESVLKEASLGRAVLVIAETIADTENIRKSLSKANYEASMVKIYVTGEEELESVASGEIIIATNIAGRGTDIETSKEVEEAGGLFICLSFLPANLRVEKQALGRTARKGNQGSGQLVINDSYERLKLSKIISKNEAVTTTTIEDFKAWRDDAETVRLEDIKRNKIAKITADDLLFSQFNHLTNQFRNANDQADKLSQNKLDSLEERWGLWLKERETTKA